MRTNPSGGNLSRKHFPKEAACGMAGKSNQSEGKFFGFSLVLLLLAHPEQGFLGVGFVLVACGLDALAHGLGEQVLLADLPQVLVSFLALLLQGKGAGGALGCTALGSHPGGSLGRAFTSYSFCASRSRAPGAMEAIRKISWLASAGMGWDRDQGLLQPGGGT